MLSSSNFTRRQVLSSAAVTAAALPRAFGANDRIRVGVIGCGNRGRFLMRTAAAVPGVQLAAVSDLYQGNITKGLELANAGAESYGEYRRLLDRKDIDAVIIATHNHWHSRVAVDALRAGKDIYLEKPMTHKLAEGPEIIRIAEEQKRVVQVGHHQRSAPVYRKARDLVASGALGPVTFVRVAFFRNSVEPQWRYPIPADASPQSIDWETFIAPTTRRPFDAMRFFQWYCYWDYCGGIATDLLVHSLDAVHLIMNAKQPTKVVADGDVLYWKDGREAPDTMSAIFQYPEGFQVNFSCTFSNKQPGTRDEFYGKDGTIQIVDASHLNFYPEPFTKNPKPAFSVSNIALSDYSPADLHMRNFLECMRSREATHCTVRDGQNSAVCAHLANMAMRERKAVRWDPLSEQLG